VVDKLARLKSRYKEKVVGPKARKWLEKNVVPGRRGPGRPRLRGDLLPQEPYDLLCAADPELAREVADYIGRFETIDRGEYAYAKVYWD
jgi:hypothetical protein